MENYLQRMLINKMISKRIKRIRIINLQQKKRKIKETRLRHSSEKRKKRSGEEDL